MLYPSQQGGSSLSVNVSSITSFIPPAPGAYPQDVRARSYRGPGNTRGSPRVHAVPAGGRRAPPCTALWAAGRSHPPAGGPTPARARTVSPPGPVLHRGSPQGTRRLRAGAPDALLLPQSCRESLSPSAPLPCWSSDSRGRKCAKLQLSGVVAPAAEAVSPAHRVGAELGKQLENAQKYFHSGQARRSLTPLLPSLAPAPLAPWPGTPRSPARGRGGVSVCECARECACACVCVCAAPAGRCQRPGCPPGLRRGSLSPPPSPAAAAACAGHVSGAGGAPAPSAPRLMDGGSGSSSASKQASKQPAPGLSGGVGARDALASVLFLSLSG